MKYILAIAALLILSVPAFADPVTLTIDCTTVGDECPECQEPSCGHPSAENIRPGICATCHEFPEDPKFDEFSGGPTSKMHNKHAGKPKKIYNPSTGQYEDVYIGGVKQKILGCKTCHNY